ncbi:MAG: excinuclease ABC subunit UvrA [Bacteroidetes bacterium]|nr:excinuclease ABC subunit UvrA [Bacteroidota bacterium]MBU1579853.1 excinuclease ABC subunit UvrA [Bacteroidota bacterium]MBU2558893.1 excinuclease ABC subunit UvrA [Bacteroidota bacterium]
MKDSFSQDEYLEIYGARVHNLKNIDLKIPRNQLVVITGLSGSGKSSLAFDTLYAEGQRRYMESFSAYARQFIGNMERPDVDKITGLSPVISIEQKSVNRNPRSTVGTITEIYDFLRLLFARASDAYSYNTGEKMIRYSEDQITQLIMDQYANKRINVLAPVVRARKGHYRELFENIRQAGFLRVRVDGELREITFGMQLDRYKTHDIEIVIDRIEVNEKSKKRVSQTVQTTLKHGKGLMQVLEQDAPEVRYFSRLLMCPTSGLSYDEPEPNTFSFNSPYGACPKCNGLGQIAEVDLKKIIPDASKNIRKGGLAPIGEYKNNWIFNQLEAIGIQYGFNLNTPLNDIPEEAIDVILYGANRSFDVKKEYLGVMTTYTLNFEGIINFIEAQNNENASPSIRRWAGSFMNHVSCPQCEGTRLKKEARFFKIDEKNIAELAEMDITGLAAWVKQLPEKLSEKQLLIGKEVLREIEKRIHFLLDVGIDYLNLNRPANTLSGGESQRIRLATQIGSQLTGVLYILDEPSIGLHQRDNHRLIESLKQLRDIGNSVIVVEHDKDTILAADYVVDIGPGAGIHGGNIVGQGKPGELLNCKSITCEYLSGKKKIEVPSKRREGHKNKYIELKGASGHNLKNVTLKLPLGKMVCVTGVSGSGKSSLINETLYPVLSQHFYRSVKSPLPYQSLKGLENIDKVIEIDQSPIGRTPRSNPATYTKVFDDIRKLYGELPESKIRGYKPGRFSFNVKGGRCEDCKGAGIRIIEMNFLPDVSVLCETCQGKRYNRETLEVRYRGKSINDILNLTINQAVEFFENMPSIVHKIKTLKDVGLGYLNLGQASTTISGGEAQRVKLASELSKKDTGHTLYILDEPTTGLHFEDVKVLLDVLNKLVDKGNTVLIIEHNMEVIKVADHLIDMGPEGGERGGYIICEGTPEEVVHCKKSHTAYYLKNEL